MSETETVTEGTTLPETAQPQAEPIDPGLLEKLAELKTLVSVNKILENCVIPGTFAGDILICQRYIQQKHGPLLKEAQSHKDFGRATNPNWEAEQKAKAAAEAKRERKIEKKTKKKAN